MAGQGLTQALGSNSDHCTTVTVETLMDLLDEVEVVSEGPGHTGMGEEESTAQDSLEEHTAVLCNGAGAMARVMVVIRRGLQGEAFQHCGRRTQLWGRLAPVNFRTVPWEGDFAMPLPLLLAFPCLFSHN